MSFGLASVASAVPSIGVKFVDNANNGVQNTNVDAMLPGDLAGAPGYAQTNWNNFGRWGGTTGANDNTGAASGVTMTWDSNNTWRTGSDTSTPNGKLMYGYIDALGVPNTSSGFIFFGQTTEATVTKDNRPIVYVKGLSAWLASVGATKYSVVAYSDGDATEGRKSEYWLQAPGGDGNDPPNSVGADLTSHVFLSDTSNFAGTFTQVPLSANTVDTAVAGNYFVFTGLSADAFLLRSEEQAFRSQFNAFQIVAEVPEPATLGLTGLAAAGLLARRRRRA